MPVNGEQVQNLISLAAPAMSEYEQRYWNAWMAYNERRHRKTREDVIAIIKGHERKQWSEGYRDYQI